MVDIKHPINHTIMISCNAAPKINMSPPADCGYESMDEEWTTERMYKLLGGGIRLRYLHLFGTVLFAPMVIGLTLTVTNWFTPEYYKSSDLWIFVLSDILGSVLGFGFVEGIMLKQKYTFQTVWAAIVAAYSFFVAITNWVSGYRTAEQVFGMLAVGIVSLVFVASSCKKNGKNTNK